MCPWCVILELLLYYTLKFINVPLILKLLNYFKYWYMCHMLCSLFVLGVILCMFLLSTKISYMYYMFAREYLVKRSSENKSVKIRMLNVSFIMLCVLGVLHMYDIYPIEKKFIIHAGDYL